VKTLSARPKRTVVKPRGKKMKLLKILKSLLKGESKDGKKKERKIMIKKTIRW